METGFATTFKEAVGRWRRRHRRPPPGETWYAVHYRAGWLVERLTFLESVHLLRQGLDVRPLAAERPPRKGRGREPLVGPEPDATDADSQDVAGSSVESVSRAEEGNAG